MLSREAFVSAINHIKEQEKRVEEFSAALNKMSCGTAVFDSDNLFLIGLRNVLKEAMCDRYDNIEWWLYETNDYQFTWSEDGQEFTLDLTDVNALYDFLVEDASRISPEHLPIKELPSSKHTLCQEKAMELSDFSSCMESVFRYLDNTDTVLHLQHEGTSKYVIMSIDCYKKKFAGFDTSETEGITHGTD